MSKGQGLLSSFRTEVHLPTFQVYYPQIHPSLFLTTADTLQIAPRAKN